MNSSLMYEILLYLNRFYLGMFFITELGVGFFKITHLPYATGTFLFEFFLLQFLCCSECCRIFMARKGNHTERTALMIISIALSIPSIIGTVYFLLWQTYVLRLEVILCGIQLVMLTVEFGLAILLLSRFYRSGTY